MPGRRIVIFAGKYAAEAAVEHVEAIADAFPDWSILIIQEFPRRSLRTILRTNIRQLRRYPASSLIEKSLVLLTKLKSAVRIQARSSSVGHPHSLCRIRRNNVRYEKVKSLDSAEARERVSHHQPWLGIAVSAPILKRTLFSIPEIGTINIHKSLLPSYRGMPSGFWEMHDGQSETGVSVHWVSDRLDTGDIIDQTALQIAPFATPFGLRAELDLLANEVLLRALRNLDSGTAQGRPQPRATDTPNRQPSWITANQVQRKCWAKRRSDSAKSGSFVKKAIKACILLAYIHLWARFRNVFRSLSGRCHTTVLLYHRVSDHFLDPVTVGIEQFWQQLVLLQRDYEILDIRTFLASRGKPRRRPAVVITFDDGYEDNLLAAQLARRAGVSCSFFVATGFLGTEKGFPHDLDRLGRRVRALTWEQLRRMAGWGFTVGNHTANHVNLGRVSLFEADEEIRLATLDLNRELDAENVLPCLAYPFGKSTDITESVRDILPGAGISYCLSAYGGTNAPDFNALDIRRMGVDFNFSLIALRALVEGWRPRSAASDWTQRQRAGAPSLGAGTISSSAVYPARPLGGHSSEMPAVGAQD